MSDLIYTLVGATAGFLPMAWMYYRVATRAADYEKRYGKLEEPRSSLVDLVPPDEYHLRARRADNKVWYWETYGRAAYQTLQRARRALELKDDEFDRTEACTDSCEILSLCDRGKGHTS